MRRDGVGGGEQGDDREPADEHPVPEYPGAPV
jgi:hypothetical protein